MIGQVLYLSYAEVQLQIMSLNVWDIRVGMIITESVLYIHKSNKNTRRRKKKAGDRIKWHVQMKASRKRETV